jgi:two-component sensor histidine kinase
MDANQIIEGMQDCVLAVSRRGVVTYANRSARERLTLSAGDDLLRRLDYERDLGDFLERCAESTSVLEHRLHISREASSPVLVCLGQRLQRVDDGAADEVLLQVQHAPGVPDARVNVVAEAPVPIEGELRVRELEHRFKNGIQMMMSALDAARRRTIDDTARRALESAMQQVQAIAQVQSIATRVLAGQTVDAQEFLSTLCEAVHRSLAPASGIAYKASVPSIPVAIYMPLALILNELVTNAVKYGASDSASPIEVRLYQADGALMLSVADHGPGFDAAKSGTGIGLGLVRELVRQLGGAFTVTSQANTQCIVAIPGIAHQKARPA